MIGPLPHGVSFLTVCDFLSTPTLPGVKLVARDGSVSVAHTTSGIINLAGSIYGVLVTPPSSDGWYVPLWDDNGGVPIADEDVFVDSSQTNHTALRSHRPSVDATYLRNFPIHRNRIRRV